MWLRVIALLSLAGCAQVFGIEETSSSTPDARPTPPGTMDGRPPCVGGDSRAVDPDTGNCFIFFSTPMSRDAARTACRALGPGTQLAGIQSASESAAIANLIGTTSALIGGSDEITEGQFLWEDGTAIQLTRWNAAEPNNGGAAGFEEDCIQMIGSTGGLWNDIPCAPVAGTTLGSYPFVCERD